MRTTPGARYEPQRADAPGRARTPASANPCLRGSLSAYSNGPSSIVCIPRTEKNIKIDFFSHSCTTTSSVAGSDLGDAGLARVQEADRLLDEPGGVVVRGRELAAVLPELFDLRLKISHGSPYRDAPPPAPAGPSAARRRRGRVPPRRRRRGHRG